MESGRKIVDRRFCQSNRHGTSRQAGVGDSRAHLLAHAAASVRRRSSIGVGHGRIPAVVLAESLEQDAASLVELLLEVFGAGADVVVRLGASLRVSAAALVLCSDANFGQKRTRRK